MDKTLEIELAEIRPKVLATAVKFFRSSRLDGDPEDVVQDVLLRLWVARRGDEKMGKSVRMLIRSEKGFHKLSHARFHTFVRLIRKRKQ